MKKVSISILIILMSLLFVSFTNIDNSSSNLYLEDGSLYITDGNMSYKVSIKNNVYMMDGLDYSDTAVYILDDNVYIGIKTTYQEDIYTVEVMSLADNYTIFTTTDDTIYDYLTPLSEKVNFYSNLAQQITEYSWNFSENHYKDEQKPSIGTMSMDRNNRTIQQMTSTDSYLEGYKRMDIEHGYKITYQDPIINIVNIVPESWLFTSGIKSYVGKEYAVIVNTIRQSETSTYGGPYYKSHVSVFDIEIGLPIKPDFADEDYYTDHSIYRSKRDIVWEIKPKFSNVYDSIRKSEMLQLSNWTRQFDITDLDAPLSEKHLEDQRNRIQQVAADEFIFAHGIGQNRCAGYGNDRAADREPGAVEQHPEHIAVVHAQLLESPHKIAENPVFGKRKPVHDKFVVRFQRRKKGPNEGINQRYRIQHKDDKHDAEYHPRCHRSAFEFQFAFHILSPDQYVMS